MARRRAAGLASRDGRTAAERLALRQELAAMLGGVCVACGWRPVTAKEWAELHFHHREREHKAYTVGTGLATRSRESLAREVAKCELRCRRCHQGAHGHRDMSAVLWPLVSDGAAWTVHDLAARIAGTGEYVGVGLRVVTARVRATMHRYVQQGRAEKVAPSTYRVLSQDAREAAERRRQKRVEAQEGPRPFWAAPPSGRVV